MSSRDFQNRGQCHQPSLQHTFTPKLPQKAAQELGRERSVLQAINPIILLPLNLSLDPQVLHSPSPRSLFPGMFPRKAAPVPSPGSLPALPKLPPAAARWQKSSSQPGKTSRIALTQSQPAEPDTPDPKRRKENSPFRGEHPQKSPRPYSHRISRSFLAGRVSRGSWHSPAPAAAPGHTALQRGYSDTNASLAASWSPNSIQGEMEYPYSLSGSSGSGRFRGLARREKRARAERSLSRFSLRSEIGRAHV